MRQSVNADEGLTHLADDEILALVQTRARRFRRQIRFRDWRELVASAVVAVMIAPSVVRGPMLARFGALVILAGLVLVAYRLWRARPSAATDAVDLALPVSTALRAELGQVDVQIELLEPGGWDAAG